MKKAIWISYDLGVRGDYESMYTWLDQHDAKECGDSMAFVSYEYKNDLLKELKASLNEAISLSKKTRIYIIHPNPSTKKRRAHGFLARGKLRHGRDTEVERGKTMRTRRNHGVRACRHRCLVRHV
jgi:hypothetical protein